jgi:hypothetical protein
VKVLDQQIDESIRSGFAVVRNEAQIRKTSRRARAVTR